MIANSPTDIIYMKKAGEITKKCLEYVETLIKPNISTLYLDKMINKFIIENDGTPAFLNYDGFPASACISVNDMVVHGIPSEKIILHEGDIVSIDVGVDYKGYKSDAARTFPVGEISPEKKSLSM